MLHSKMIRIVGRILIALLTVSLFSANLIAQNAVTFKVAVDGIPVTGLTIEVNGMLRKSTNPAGQAVVYLPDGDYTYSIFTEGSPEYIVIGSNTITYKDDGGQDKPDSYDNIFVLNDTMKVSGEIVKNVSLTTTTFKTTSGGVKAPVKFSVMADYSGGGGKVKTLTEVTSNDTGSISLPIPRYRDRRSGDDIMEFENYEFSAVGGLVTGAFEPDIGPVKIDLPAFHDVTFSINAGDTAVQGITIQIGGISGKTDAFGKVILNIPEGNSYYSVYTKGTPESIIIGTNTITYHDDGGQDNPDSYDNIFVFNDTVLVSGERTKNITLATTSFNTTDNGIAAPIEFDITADYSGGGGKVKTLTTVSSNDSGSITLPLPTHRDRRTSDEIMEFENFEFSAHEGQITGAFEPDNSPIEIDIPAFYDVTFTVKAGGYGVEGITVDAGGVTAKTNLSGQVILNLPGDTTIFSVYTAGSPEFITIGSNTFTYKDDGGRDDKTDSYDNIFVYNDTVIVAGTMTKDVALTTTIFNTTDKGSVASVAFDITADYYGGGSKVKTLTSVLSNASGTISLPLPTHRDRREDDDIFEFIDYEYSILEGRVTDGFDPEVSPVNINVPALNDVSITVTAGDTAVEGITVNAAGSIGRTNATGQVTFSLPDGDYTYSVYTEGSPEEITIGSNTFTYLDDGGRDNPDSYDNIFVLNDTMKVSGATAKNVVLLTTLFKTTVGGGAHPAEFDITADYYGGGSKVKTLVNLTSNDSGIVSLPLPMYRDRRTSDEIMKFVDYRYSLMEGLTTGGFDPENSPVSVDLPSFHDVTFEVSSGDTTVEGITVDVGGITGITNASGIVILNVPEGNINYSVYTKGTPEVLIIGSDTISYNDIGGDDKVDSYDNIFIYKDTVIISGIRTKNVALTTTLFNTSKEGSAGPVEFDITADYSGGGSKVKTLVTVSSNDSGKVSIPLPTHRDRQQDDDIFEFFDYMYTTMEGLIGEFNPENSPVNIDVPSFYDVTFTVKAGGYGVQGITVDAEGVTGITDASGQVILNLPKGTTDYSVYTENSPETITIGTNTITYKDDGGRDDRTDRYDNIFVLNDTVIVSGVRTKEVALTTTIFNTTAGGNNVSLKFNIMADYSGGGEDVKTITIVTSNAGGSISLPLPTHRDSRQDDIHEFRTYSFSDIYGSTVGIFDPEVSPVNITVPSLGTVSFNVKAGGIAVEGITVGLSSFSEKTDVSGKAVFNDVPNDFYKYSVYTEGMPEYITIGTNTFIYNDMGGRDKPDSYDNFFLLNDTVMVSGTTVKDIALTTTTFNTTVAGNTASAEFDVTADYFGGGSKVKTLTTVTSNASGTISLPLPTHRDHRDDDAIYKFIDYKYSVASGLITGAFDPEISPVDVVLPAFNDVTFTVTAGGTAVEGITVDVGGVYGRTNASGNVILSLPDGNLNYSVYTAGTPEVITVGGNTFIYNDDGGRDKPDSYENFFVFDEPVVVSGSTSKHVALTTTLFNTTVGGIAASAEFDITAEHSSGGNKVKTLTKVTSDATGSISLPLPTHRDRRESDDIMEFINYMYSALGGIVTGEFNPESSPVKLNIPALHEVTFNVAAGGTAVEGITVNSFGVSDKTDASGTAVLHLPAGQFDYSVLTRGIPETIIIGTNTFIYNDDGGRDKPDSYDNIFVLDETIAVSGPTVEGVELSLTTFNTTMGGNAAAVEFDITADYDGGGSKVKTLTSLTSKANGTISLPLPKYRDRKTDDDIFEFIDYMYSAAGGQVKGEFDPETSPVNIAIPELYDVTFKVTAGGLAVEGMTVSAGGSVNITDASGMTTLRLTEGENSYSVFTDYSPEIITVGENTFTYNDIGGDGRLDSYDNIFVYNEKVTVKDATTEDVVLLMTTFNTTVAGSAAPLQFSVTADYAGGGSKAKTLTSVTSNAEGIISLPLPTHRNRREDDDIFEFIDYMYSIPGGLIQGSFDPKNSPVNIAVENSYGVTFNVRNEYTSNPILGAIVSINENALSATDAKGQITAYMSEGTYLYKVTRSGYEDLSYSPFTVSGVNLSVSASMIPSILSQLVTFSVTDNATSNPIQGAIISIDGEAPVVTDAAGKASVYMQNGSYDYTITKEDYRDISPTSFTVSSTDLTLPVSMTSTVGLDKHHSNIFTCYPNPASESVTIKFAESYTGIVELWSIRGKLILQQELHSEFSRTIDVSSIQRGIYILRTGSDRMKIVIE